MVAVSDFIKILRKLFAFLFFSLLFDTLYGCLVVWAIEININDFHLPMLFSNIKIIKIFYLLSKTMEDTDMALILTRESENSQMWR